MINTGKQDPLFEGVYGGFSAPEPPPQPRPRLDIPRPEARTYDRETYRQSLPPPRRRKTGVVLTGVLAALGLGAAFGFLGRPDLKGPVEDIPPAPPPPPVLSVEASTPGADEMSAEEISRLALGEAQTAPAVPVAKAQSPAAPPPVVKVVRPPAVEARTPAPTKRVAAPAPARVAEPPARMVRASVPRTVQPAFHCDWALRPSERMVCGDAELAALDNRLNRAFMAAVRAGVPRPLLREEQDRWVLVNRERAARHSRGAVEDVYRERIAELEDLARGR